VWRAESRRLELANVGRSPAPSIARDTIQHGQFALDCLRMDDDSPECRTDLDDREAFGVRRPVAAFAPGSTKTFCPQIARKRNFASWPSKNILGLRSLFRICPYAPRRANRELQRGFRTHPSRFSWEEGDCGSAPQKIIPSRSGPASATDRRGRPGGGGAAPAGDRRTRRGHDTASTVAIGAANYRIH
jgi:hypothetical protein